MLIDLHADTTLLMHWLGFDFCRRHRPLLPGGAGRSHTPGMQDWDAATYDRVADPQARWGAAGAC